jgi:ATP-dependent DNA ligase
MLAKAQAKVPDEAGVWSYEPKWDGFPGAAVRDGDELVIQSRSGKDLGRYFPELDRRCSTSWRRAACSTARWS